jgi:hypothetical protein
MKRLEKAHDRAIQNGQPINYEGMYPRSF